MGTSVTSSEADGITTITLSRASKKNALTGEMYDELTALLREVSARDEARVVLLRGSHGVFTAGNDLEDFSQSPPASLDSPVGRFLTVLTQFPLPLIAAVEGPAIGIGTTLLLHCDLAYATTSARFALPFVRLGLCPEAASSYLLPRLCGHRRASELLLLGEPFDASVALEIGLVNECLPTPEALYERAMERARSVAQQPARALRVTKQLLREGTMAAVREAVHNEGAMFFELLRSPEAREALDSFLRSSKR